MGGVSVSYPIRHPTESTRTKERAQTLRHALYTHAKRGEVLPLSPCCLTFTGFLIYLPILTEALPNALHFVQEGFELALARDVGLGR